MPNESPPGGQAIRRAGDPAAVVVMTGGRARRFGSDKTRAPLAGRPLLDHVLDRCPAGVPVVVGPPRPVPRDVVWVREDPPFGGPVAALAAALAVAPDVPVVVLLAADAPFAPAAVPRLLAALDEDVDGAVGTDADGRRQWLVGAYRTAALRAALPVEVEGASLRSVLGGLRLAEVPLTADEALDVDDPAALARLDPDGPTTLRP